MTQSISNTSCPGMKVTKEDFGKKAHQDYLDRQASNGYLPNGRRHGPGSFGSHEVQGYFKQLHLVEYFNGDIVKETVITGFEWYKMAHHSNMLCGYDRRCACYYVVYDATRLMLSSCKDAINFICHDKAPKSAYCKFKSHEALIAAIHA